jgi:four helix bundle protein
MSGFRNLIVWQRSKDLAIEIYRITQQGTFSNDFGLKNQIRKASVSISSNIAEGDERASNKEAVRFLYIAKGSLAELQTQMEIAHEIGYLNSEKYEFLDMECRRIGKMLGTLIKARTTRNP